MPTNRALSPETLTLIERLRFQVRRNAQGHYSGQHRSPHHGASIEFNDHKEYVPGDDLRRLDWRVFAKSDRYYLKRYEQETRLSAVLLLDASASMEYRSHDLSKLDVACQLLLAFAHVLINQSDAPALVVRSGAERIRLPASAQLPHLGRMAALLEGVTGQGETGLHGWIEEALDGEGRAPLFVIFSDLLCEPEPFLKSLRTLAAGGRETLLFQVLDPFELRFPFSLRTRFKDMETPRELTLEPLSVKAEYLRLLRGHTELIRNEALRMGVAYHLCDTSLPAGRILTDFFCAREAALHL